MKRLASAPLTTLALALAMLTAACGAVPAAPPLDEAQRSQDSASGGGPGETGGATGAASSEQPGGGGLAGNLHGAPDLEEILPAQVGDRVLLKVSFNGEDFLGQEEAHSESLNALLADVGRSPEDLSVAWASDTSGQFVIFVFQVDGVQGERTLEFFLEDEQQMALFDFSEQPLGGRRVMAAAAGEFYMYADGEFFYQIIGDEELAEDALSQLP